MRNCCRAVRTSAVRRFSSICSASLGGSAGILVPSQPKRRHLQPIPPTNFQLVPIFGSRSGRELRQLRQRSRNWRNSWHVLVPYVHGIVGDRLGRNFLPPVRRLCGNRNNVAFGQVVSLSSVNSRSSLLIGTGLLDTHQCSSGHERGLALDDDEEVVGLLVILRLTRFPAIGQIGRASCRERV